MRLGFAVAEDQNAGRETGAVENVLAETDHCFEYVHLQQLAADLALLGHAEQHAMRKHHCHTAILAGHGLDHVLNPGEVAGFSWRQPGKVAAVGVVDPDIVPPLFQGEGRISDYAVKGGEAVA